MQPAETSFSQLTSPVLADDVFTPGSNGLPEEAADDADDDDDETINSSHDLELCSLSRNNDSGIKSAEVRKKEGERSFCSSFSLWMMFYNFFRREFYKFFSFTEIFPLPTPFLS